MDRLAKIINNQFLSYLRKNEEENIIWVVDPDDFRLSYCLVFGLAGEFGAGEYLFRLGLKDSDGATVDYPNKPPKIGCLTPNGIFSPDGGSICVSVGEFHSNVDTSTYGKKYATGWRKTLGIVGYTKSVVYGIMVDWKNVDAAGIRILSGASDEQVKEYAKNSYEFNRASYPHIMTAVDNFVSEHPEAKVSLNLIKEREKRSSLGV